MQDHLVSICLPTYNRPVTLERTLNSLVSQTYTNIEIIVSDNCSPDSEVKSVINKFKSDLRIKYFRQEVNKGPIFNFNFVFSKVSGSFFMVIGDDDWLDDNYVDSCLHFLLKNSDYSAAYGTAKIFSRSGDFFSNDVQPDLTDNSSEKRIKRYLQSVSYNSTYYALIRGEFLLNFSLTNVIAIDWLIVSRVAFLGKYKLLSNTHINLSLGGDSSSIANLANAYGLPEFTKKHPYLSICWNLFFDITLYSSAYKKLNLIKRFKLARGCFHVIYIKFKLEIIKELATSTSKSLLLNKWILSNIIKVELENPI